MGPSGPKVLKFDGSSAPRVVVAARDRSLEKGAQRVVVSP